MPTSRARTAICSAPLECPSRPGLPTRILMRRPSASPTRATSSRSSSSSEPTATGPALASPTPVGARYSPNVPRSACAHSPVVTPARAASIDAGMMLTDSSRAAAAGGSSAGPSARRESLQRSIHRRLVALRAPRASGLEGGSLDTGIDRHDPAVLAAGERRILGGRVDVLAHHLQVAGLDRRHGLAGRLDELSLHVRDGLDRAAVLGDD